MSAFGLDGSVLGSFGAILKHWSLSSVGRPSFLSTVGFRLVCIDCLYCFCAAVVAVVGISALVVLF